MAPDWPLSQVVVHRNGRTFFTGVGKGLSEREMPGAIQIWKMDEKSKWMERTNEIQAHSKAVERIRLTHDNSFLFSCGQDGVVCIFDVKDRDKMRQVQEVRKLEFSKEIITEKATMDTMITEKISFENELKNLRQNHDQDVSNRL